MKIYNVFKTIGILSLFALLLAPVAQALTLQEILQGYDNPKGQVLGAASDTITVTNNTRQLIQGFGSALQGTNYYSPGPGDALLSAGGSLRDVAIEKAYNQVKLNMGGLGQLLESPGDYSQRQNSGADPNIINWAGFNGASTLDLVKKYVVDLAKPYGFKDYYLGHEAPNVRWASPWLKPIRTSNYNLYIQYAARQVVADVTYWKNLTGEEQPYYMLGAEQFVSGNASSDGGNQQEIVDIAKEAGARLRAAGFNRIKFVVGTEESLYTSLFLATKVLNDPVACQYVGAVGYHVYSYETNYSNIPWIISTSGSGNPDAAEIRLRQQLRDLVESRKDCNGGQPYPVWLEENSHGNITPLAYDDMRGRAIHIHDEFLYAQASVYDGEGSIWSLESEKLHFGTGANFYGEPAEGAVVLVNNDTGAVDITGIGYAIGHYARWITPNATYRIDSDSGDPLVQVTAMRDDAKGRLALVLINNNSFSKTVTVNLSGLSLTGGLSGEQSTPSAYWQAISPITPSSPGSFNVTLPAQSVVSVAGSTSGGSNPPPAYSDQMNAREHSQASDRSVAPRIRRMIPVGRIIVLSLPPPRPYSLPSP